VNDSLSLADISVGVAFVNLAFAGHQVDAARWKNLARYIENIKQEAPFCGAGCTSQRSSTTAR